MEHRLNIGDKVYKADYSRTEKLVPCPDCCGNKYLTVIMGNGDHVRIECAGCSAGYEPPKGTVVQYEFEATTVQRTVTGIRLSSDSIEYELNNFGGGCYYTGKPGELFATKEEAQAQAEILKDAHEKAENARFLAKTKDHRSWAWNASYHLRCARDAEKQAAHHRAKAQVCAVKSSSPQPTDHEGTNV